MNAFIRICLLLLLVSASLSGQDFWEEYSRSTAFYQNAEFDSALYFAQKVSPADSLYFYAQLLSGHAYLQMDSLKEAERVFSALLQTGTHPAYVYNGLGLCYLQKFQKTRGVFRALKRLFSASDLDKARKYFQQALSSQPNYPDARLNLARSFLAAGKKEEAEKAFLILKTLVQEFPQNVDFLYYLGICKELLDDNWGAIQEYFKILKIEPLSAKTHLRLAFVYFKLQEYPLFSRHYLAACRALKDRKLINRLLVDIGDILSADERAHIQKDKIDGNFFIQFWEQRDPNPVSEENERLIEHYKRLDYARMHYSAETEAGYDDRGKIYVRFGTPQDYFRSVTPRGFVLENESWVYRIGNDTYTFDFVKKDVGFSLVTDLSSAITNPSYNLILPSITQLYRERSHLSPYYFKIYSALENLKQRGQSGALLQIKSTITRLSSEQRGKSSNLPTAVYKIEWEGKDLQYDLDLFKYWSRVDSTWRAAVFYGLNLNQLPAEFSENLYKIKLQEGYALKGGGRSVIRKETERLALVARNASDFGYYVNVLEIPLDPDASLLYFQLRHPRSQNFRLVELPLQTSELKGKQLILSDVLLSPTIREAAPQDDPKFCRRGNFIQPFPSRNFDKRKPVYSYVEISNLFLDSEDRARVRIEYRVQEHQTLRNLTSLVRLLNPFQDKNVQGSQISVSYEREFDRRDHWEIMSFDMSGLADGAYIFTVIVSDLNTGDSAHASKVLNLF